MGFSTLSGPFHYKMEGETLLQGLWIEARHLNRTGIVHGGLLLTLADSTIGAQATLATGARTVTIQLNSRFLVPVRQGQWLEARARIRKITRTLVFCDAELQAGQRLVFLAGAVCRRLRPQPKPPA